MVVDTGSIRAAAKGLNLTQAAVTKAIRELEEELDAPLVVRSSRGIGFTESGRRLTDRFRLAWSQLELARQEIRQLQGGEVARVGVGVTPTAMLTVLPEVVREFRRQMPLATLHVEEGLMKTVVAPLRQGLLDFAIAAPGPGNLPADFTMKELGKMGLIVVCREGHPAQKAKKWSQLEALDWIYHPAHNGQSHRDFLATKGVLGPSNFIVANTFAATWSLLTQTDALLLCAEPMLRVPIYGELVRKVPVEVDAAPLTLGIIHLKDVPLSRAAERLVSLFERSIRNSILCRTGPSPSQKLPKKE